jgi:hypothetical protein
MYFSRFAKMHCLTEISIVFVHGLNGHRENTWRYEGAAASWPEALLSQDITNARIMTFGYDATVVNWDEFLGKVSSNRIKQHAQNLLETLASYRFDDKSREVCSIPPGPTNAGANA